MYIQVIIIILFYILLQHDSYKYGGQSTITLNYGL